MERQGIFRYNKVRNLSFGGLSVKKRIIVSNVVVLCIASIIVGHFYWKQKISKPTAASVESSAENIKEDNSKQNDTREDYAKNLPEDVQKKIKTALKEEKQLNFVIWGSESVPSDQNGWPEKLKKELLSAYGDELFNISIVSDAEETTHSVLNKKLYKKIADKKPDILLFEPFILNDNGVVGIDNTLSNITDILRKIQEANPDVSIMLQPAHPLFGAKFYPKEVDALKQYAEENHFTYLNHWENWPDKEDEQLKQYVTEDRSKPSEKGNQVWGEYLINYFVAADE